MLSGPGVSEFESNSGLVSLSVVELGDEFEPLLEPVPEPKALLPLLFAMMHPCLRTARKQPHRDGRKKHRKQDRLRGAGLRI